MCSSPAAELTSPGSAVGQAWLSAGPAPVLRRSAVASEVASAVGSAVPAPFHLPKLYMGLVCAYLSAQIVQALI